VGFDRGKGLFSPPHTIAYTWTENVKPGTLIHSPHFKKLKYISIGMGTTKSKKAPSKEKEAESKKAGEEKAGESGWVTVEVNLLEDYRRAFPKDKKKVPPIAGIVLKCDSNNTGTSAEAWLSTLELIRAD
jgi:hypothetical protein